jgi:hypothetical protein
MFKHLLVDFFRVLHELGVYFHLHIENGDLFGSNLQLVWLTVEGKAFYGVHECLY